MQHQITQEQANKNYNHWLAKQKKNPHNYEEEFESACKQRTVRCIKKHLRQIQEIEIIKRKNKK